MKDYAETEAERLGYNGVGLNSAWSVRAWSIDQNNERDDCDGLLILENEDRKDEFSIVYSSPKMPEGWRIYHTSTARGIFVLAGNREAMRRILDSL